MDRLELIRRSQSSRKESIEEPSLSEVSKMIHDIDFLLGLVGSLTLQNEMLKGRLNGLGDGSYDYNHYSAVEDLGG